MCVGFKQICDILALMVTLVEEGNIQVPLWDSAQVPDPNMNNQLFVRQYLGNLLQTAFTNLQPYVELVRDKMVYMCLHMSRFFFFWRGVLTSYLMICMFFFIEFYSMIGNKYK